MNSQKQVENEINCYKYEQYNSVWCKVIDRNELDLNQKNQDDNLLIQSCIEEIYYYYTPESFSSPWDEDNWILSSQNEHEKIIEEMIKYCFIFIEKERQEAIKERDIRLSYSDLKSIEEYKNASPEIKERINLEEYYKYSFIDKDENPKLDFTKHQELKNNFLNNLFSKDKVRFYYNKNLEETTQSLSQEDRDNVPAIIGVDNEKIALFWFNF
ncbi:hypothetical protein Fleli_0125 [Bernardetia litoralis DSM 6794]|uniref:Uncharacterized protein n=1 Tax=Bernardetia litoralis (strain ATCC 23117 / DSM 6794 / NBRC 15988 / NCIMB 1366 / Fx l1 / Sio-4) TaxID=880071 RepID=I4AF90_BERLS|nr:hypothetical protein [Bernardetia litoralis]AFM02625.1 hypothetical protein Fleli_0125 [Bernardetia litoralis DSM 6794]